jgi:hypothetical protein
MPSPYRLPNAAIATVTPMPHNTPNTVAPDGLLHADRTGRSTVLTRGSLRLP